MAKLEVEVIDSQFIAENISFLDNCFDSSFVLQSTLQTVKEYAAEESITRPKKSSSNNKIVTNSQNASVSLDCTRCDQTVSPKRTINNRRLRDWGLPLEIAKKYEERGITEMFEWQVQCLSNSKVVFDCCNLVYSAPTSAGKTLVAEMLTIKTILERQKKVIVILPFVSIVREKMFYLRDILSSSGVRVEGFMGSQSPPGGLQAVHVAICTIEKANSLVNRLLDEGNISELGAVVVDELHLLGDPHRGYILELLLTKIKYVSSKQNDVLIQIVGMSATLPNLEVLANWLNAELFVTQFRPIPLDEYCLVGNNYYDRLGKSLNNIGTPLDIDGDNVLKICLETIRDGCSILIFCMTKNWCESLAQSTAMSFYKLGCGNSDVGSILRTQLNTASIQEVLEQLKNCPVGLDQVLKKTVSFGVSYHHAGLTFDERDIIEGAFKLGAIRVLVATSTLSSGVNLPARKVIIRSPVFQRQPINILTYKQMIGRAGRMGRDTKGESILICSEAEKKMGFDLMMGALDPVKSCIESEDKYMRAVLEMIASQVICTKEELDLYSKCTLLFTQQEISPSKNFLLENTLEELKNYELVRIQTDGDEEHYVATALGKACLSSSMAPNDGLSLFCELQKARQCLVLETDLHLIYLVTPYSVSSQWGEIDWLHLLTLWESLTKAMKKVGELVGVQERFIIGCVRGNNKSNNIKNKVNIHKRFYTALALQDLVNEVPLSEVATKFQCARGFLQSLQQGAATFAGMVTAFCRQLGWKNMEILISQFQDRLHFGIHSDLLELMKLPSLNGMRARTLFDSGFESISSIASAEANTIENILHKTIPFQSEKTGEEDDSNDVRKRNKIKSIWITGCCGMTTKEAAENLIAEARRYLVHEIGVSEIKWDKPINIAADAKSEIKINSETLVNGHAPANVVELNSSIHKKYDAKTSSPNISLAISKMDHSLIENILTPKQNIQSKLKQSCNESIGVNLTEEPESTNYTIINTTHLAVKNEMDEIKEIVKNNVNFKSSETATSSPCLSMKDEIVWDSLTFTDATLDNITKLRPSDKMFSPNIIFGESEEILAVSNNITSSKCNSTKDISLFSSEGDNSSLFEESLPLDLIPSKLLDNEPTITCKQEISSTYLTMNSNTILNAFNTTLHESSDDDEDIKLVYEDDNEQFEENFIMHDNKHEGEDKNTVTNNFSSPYKRRKAAYMDSQPITKRKKGLEDINKTMEDKSFKFQLKINHSMSRTFTIEFNKIKMNCYLLKGDDIMHNLDVIDKLKDVSLYFDIQVNKCILAPNKIIGSNILNAPKPVEMVDKSKNECLIRGMAMYVNQACSIFLDLSSLGCMQIITRTLHAWLKKSETKLKLLCSKAANFYLKRWLDVNLPTNIVDISLNEWLINNEIIPHINNLTNKYCGVDLSYVLVNNRKKTCTNLDVYESSCIKAWSIWTIAEKQEIELTKSLQILGSTIDTERQISKILADCEHYGITLDKDLASRLLIDVRNSVETLEKKAYKLCGYHFNFNSSKDVAKVLGMYNGRKVSTKKSVLSSHNSPMASIVIYWRKLNSILTQTLYPLTEKACIYSEGDRINPTYTMFTCTGRISMHKPNLQNVPRTFSIPSEYLTLDNPTCDEVIEFNCRNIFKAGEGYVMVSADYCQLEMRILTHFSDDPVLMKIMKSDMDVFKSIAASWSNTPEDEVDDDLRQKAKQLCYGIIYGMGNKTLSKHLDVSEIEAAMFMDGFYGTYPAVKKFTQSVVDECRARGYIETLTKRRRYLPDIKSNVPSKRSAAERQSVNTTIQGSAADIAKAAMCAIDSRTEALDPKPRLVLQMHDELIYEVPVESKESFTRILKEVMEGTMELKVPLPVKVKCGCTWGKLEEVVL